MTPLVYDVTVSAVDLALTKLGKIGAAFIRGVQERVQACPKHYAASNTDEARSPTGTQRE